MKIWRIACGRTSGHMKFSPSVTKAGPDSRTAKFYAPPKMTASKFYQPGDQTLTYEQNLTGRTIAIVALSSVEWDILNTTCR